MTTLALEPPKRKSVKKTIMRTGPNGTFEGAVEILFNHRSEDEERPIPCVERKQKFFHIIRGNADQVTWVSEEFTNKEDAVHLSKTMERHVIEQLEDWANKIQPEKDSVEVSLKNMGYV